MKASQILFTFVALLVLALGQTVAADDGQMAGSQAQVVTVNINKADAETLARELIGVGRSRAEAIVKYREEFGPFYSAEELTAVKGVGMATIIKNQQKIVVE